MAKNTEELMIFLGNKSITQGWGYIDADKNLILKPKRTWAYRKLKVPKDKLDYCYIELMHHDPFAVENDTSDRVRVFLFGLEDFNDFNLKEAIPEHLVNEFRMKDELINQISNSNEKLLRILQARGDSDAENTMVANKVKQSKDLNIWSHTPFIPQQNKQNNQ